jgi:hypothetical protein
MLHFSMDCRIKSGNDAGECILAAQFFAPELCKIVARISEAQSGAASKRQIRSRISLRSSGLRRKGKAERRKAHCPTMSAPTDKSAKLICARRARCFQRAHLSALTLAALATGYYPMAQLQNRVSRGGR